jgi:RNA polymerase sigma-70 factor (ECF subfamily)
MDPRSDADLARAFRAGDASAFEAFYDRYHEWVAALALRFTGHREDALDVLQETFSYLFRRGRDFELRSQMKTFLYPVVKHLSIAARRLGADQDDRPPRCPAGVRGLPGDRRGDPGARAALRPAVGIHGLRGPSMP